MQENQIYVFGDEKNGLISGSSIIYRVSAIHSKKPETVINNVFFMDWQKADEYRNHGNTKSIDNNASIFYIIQIELLHGDNYRIC